MPEQAKKLNNEVQYLKRIGALLVLNTPPETLLKKVAKLASEVCRTPIAFINLIDHNQQWVQVSFGMVEAATIGRNIAFFSHALIQNEVAEISDAQSNSRFENNPLVTQKPKLRFYAGAPIIMPSGKKVGTLCVIDQNKGTLSPLQKTMLEELAHVISQALVYTQQMDGKTSELTKLSASSSVATPRHIDAAMEDQNRLTETMAA